MKFRFVTPHRSGKWYPSIEAAQQNAPKIGAGFFDDQQGIFYPYPGSRLETCAGSPLSAMVASAIRAPGKALQEHAAQNAVTT